MLFLLTFSIFWSTAHCAGINSPVLAPAGHYDMVVVKQTQTTGDLTNPKDKFYLYIDVITNEKGEELVNGKIVFLENCGPLKARFRIFIWLKDHYASVAQMTFPVLCNEQFVNNIIKRYLDVDKNCIVKKGNYTFFENINEKTHLLLGDYFYYGKFKVDFTLSSRKKKFYHNIIMVETAPKKVGRSKSE